MILVSILMLLFIFGIRKEDWKFFYSNNYELINNKNLTFSEFSPTKNQHNTFLEIV
jgi:hypothetical protein